MLGGRAVYPEGVSVPKRRFRDRSWDKDQLRQSRILLWSGWLLFGVSLGIGVLIGWAIWGL
jgi:hypothetical protein